MRRQSINRPVIGSQYVAPEAQVVSLVLRNRSSGTHYLHPRVQDFTTAQRQVARERGIQALIRRVAGAP
jgi:hypothetical protein